MVCPTSPPPSPDPTLDDRLHALAAHELAPDEAEALRGLIREDPRLARRFEAIEALEARLGAEAPWAMPPDLAGRIVGGLPGRGRLLSLHRALRVAAAILVAFTAWFAATGAVPTAALADPAPALRDAIRPAQDLLPTGVLPTLEAPSLVTEQPLGTAALGIVLLVIGLVLARRLLTPASPSRRPDV